MPFKINRVDDSPGINTHIRRACQCYLAPCWWFGLVVRLLVIAFKLTGAPAVVRAQRTALSLNIFIYHIWEHTRERDHTPEAVRRDSWVDRHPSATDLHQGRGGPHMERHHRSPLKPSQLRPHVQLAKKHSRIKANKHCFVMEVCVCVLFSPFSVW